VSRRPLLSGNGSGPLVSGMSDVAFYEEGGAARCIWMCSRTTPADDAKAHYFSTDDVLIYDPYYGDFGPLNIAQLCRYSRMLSAKLEDPELKGKKICHVCKPQTDTRANSILLAGAWLIIAHQYKPEQAWAPFAGVKPALVPYRDASLGPPSYALTVFHCFQGLYRAIYLGWYKHDEFDPDQYEHYERVENGDFNWIVPGKFLAFSGPTQTPIAYVDGVKTNTPETYFDYFHANNITGVVRFNNKVYDRKKFLDAQLNHYDLYFADGGNPTDQILKRFLEIAEEEKGALAVHCKAGLGRTGTLISLYLMKHFLVTTPEIISWLRLCRPGSVIGPQQNFLAEMEARMHKMGKEYQDIKAGQNIQTPYAKALEAHGGDNGGLAADMGGCSVSPGAKGQGARAATPSSPTPKSGGAKPSGFGAVGGVRSGAPGASPTRGGAASPSKAKPAGNFLGGRK